MSSSPAQATWIGFLALERGHPELGRKAALRALGYSGLYPRARTLAARVALGEARLDDAMKSIQELDPKTPEVAVVRAAAAYETLNLAELENALEAMGPEGTERPLGLALGKSLGLAMGSASLDPESASALAKDEIPWGDLVAVDALLNQGAIEPAAAIADRWGDRRQSPVYALRVARLERYRGNAEAAVAASKLVLEAGVVTPAMLVEAVYDLASAKYYPAARDLLAKYPAVLGPTSGWLQGYVDAMSGRGPRAKAFVAGIGEPEPEAPLLHRVIAARALALVRDRRAKPSLAALLKVAKGYPEVMEAGKWAGVVR
jgi:hypothetical protein